MRGDLTQGGITKGLLLFALPLVCGNLLQQLYNLVDTWLVGRFLGEAALAAVGSSYILMTFLTSILLGLCMGSSAYFAIQFGRRDMARLRQGIFQSFLIIGGLTLVLNLGVFLALPWILQVLRIPAEVLAPARTYLWWVFWGIAATFFYNFFASLLRAVGDSVTPLKFLGVSVVLNIGLDVLFLLPMGLGVMGAALATVLSQYTAGLGLALYAWKTVPHLRVGKEDRTWEVSSVRSILSLSLFTCLQQSVMNGGILAIQGLVNSFGTTVMAAFAVASKIDTLCYMPIQDFGNAFSTFVGQNYGAGRRDRIQKGVVRAAACSAAFSLAVGLLVAWQAPRLMAFFAGAQAVEAVGVGTGFLRIEAPFYFALGILFLLYGYFRAVDRPAVSVVLTVCSLGTRVALAYALSPFLGVTVIWAAIPIGWFFADAVGLFLLRREGTAFVISHNT
ncbi:MAG: MATE family efflux transporter [Ruminiclostridium sp.]|nr:MATE family efflux transporter [Ruminiclostridium sp.]MBQ9932464.1 MATE family efflux transporter [Ruminiclostridium sp.]